MQDNNAKANCILGITINIDDIGVSPQMCEN